MLARIYLETAGFDPTSPAKVVAVSPWAGILAPNFCILRFAALHKVWHGFGKAASIAR